MTTTTRHTLHWLNNCLRQHVLWHFALTHTRLRLKRFVQELGVANFAGHIFVEVTHQVVDFVFVQNDVGKFKNGAELWQRQVALVLLVQFLKRAPQVLPFSRQLCRKWDQTWSATQQPTATTTVHVVPWLLCVVDAPQAVNTAIMSVIHFVQTHNFLDFRPTLYANIMTSLRGLRCTYQMYGITIILLEYQRFLLLNNQ